MNPEEAKTALEDIRTAAVRAAEAAGNSDEALAIVNTYLGRRSDYTSIKKALGSFEKDARKEIGRTANEVKDAIENAVATRRSQLEAGESQQRLEEERIDVTLPGRMPTRGGLHPLTLVLDELIDVFVGLGFKVVEGPEVETDWYNFQALNIPPDHPARAETDTLWVEPNAHGQPLMRTHTSPMQARVMQSQPPPVYVVVPGRCARRETSNHKNFEIFHQIEGLAVDEGITFADMKGTLQTFAKALFGSAEIRLTPDYFPFTEPSAQVSLLCFVCQGSGCRTCQREGWIELLGAGMVHPNVFRAVGYDPEITGFAFGLGIERAAMLRYGIPDGRVFLENDVRFLSSF